MESMHTVTLPSGATRHKTHHGGGIEGSPDRLQRPVGLRLEPQHMRQVVQGLKQDPPALPQVLSIALGQVYQGTDALQPLRSQL